MSMRRIFGAVLICSFAAIGAAQVAAAAPPAYADGVVLVGYKASAPGVARASLRAAVGVQSAEALSHSDRNAEKLMFKPGTNIDAVIKQLLRDPNVRYAHPDYRVTTALSPNDPQFTNGTLWGMLGDATTPANQFGSQAAEVWAQGYVGSQQVVVGVIGEGLQFAHPDLVDNIWTNPYEIPGNGIDDDVDEIREDLQELQVELQDKIEKLSIADRSRTIGAISGLLQENMTQIVSFGGVLSVDDGGPMPVKNHDREAPHLTAMSSKFRRRGAAHLPVGVRRC